MKKILIPILVTFVFVFSLPFADAASLDVPAVIGYHSAIYDEGGNSIADGEWSVSFAITDVDGTALYEEWQTVTAVGGQVSALIGNGLTSAGAPTGGVPLDAMDPDGGRYLEVEFEGMDPLPAMELAAVPYANYAQVALGASDGSITFEALSNDALDDIAEELTGGEGKGAIILRSELDTLYNDPSSASTMGIATSGFTNTSSSDLQGALGDLDAAIGQNSAGIQTLTNTTNSLTNSLNAEISNRASADSAEASARSAADSAEASTRSAADGALDARVAAVENSARLSFMHSAWGTVTGGPSPSMNGGANASVSRVGGGQYRIDLSPAMSNANYAVVVTPSDNSKVIDSSTAGAVKVYSKTASSFYIQFVGLGNESFDFIVLGN